MRFGALSPKKAATPPAPRDFSPPKFDGEEDVSPELIPIVTLLLAQTHRRYHEGIFMLYNDLNGDGKPGEKVWREVYGILTGNQLAYWDAANLAKFKDMPEQLFETSSKPNYLNFTDAVFNAMTVLPAAKQQLENVIIVLTTLKNRYIIQFRLYEMLREWYLCLRLAMFEYQQLQEAYTGALLLARGSRLLDIRTILAEKRFNHQDWVKIRYGSGTAWKRLFAVIEPSVLKKKIFTPGRVLLYELENLKKKNLVGVITNATTVTAVYPQLPFFIDKSTIMKLEASINFTSPSLKPSKKSSADVQETSLFLMPEAHSSVPGFDTLIRFLIPLYDSFGLYGRPKRLKADREDSESLVFGLPTLPHVHYLNLADIYPLTELRQYLAWDAGQWRENLKRILRLKLAQGYDGCGSTRGVSGALSSLSLPRMGSPNSLRKTSMQSSQQVETPRLALGPMPSLSLRLTPNLKPEARVALAGSPVSANYSSTGNLASASSGPSAPSALGSAAVLGAGAAMLPHANLREKEAASGRNPNNLAVNPGYPTDRQSVQLAEIYHKYSKIQTPSDRFNDRNKILNGSSEEFDETALPSLIRKKSLMHGPYPTNDKKLLESEPESDLESESSDTEADGDDQGRQAPAAFLAVPHSYGNRNSSHSSVQSPLTQYNEFNRQFSQTVDRNGPSQFPSQKDANLRSAENIKTVPSSEDEEELDLSTAQSPPPVPAHTSPPRNLRQRSPERLQYAYGQPNNLIPQIQQVLSLHEQTTHTPEPLTPSLAQRANFHRRPYPQNEGETQGGADSRTANDTRGGHETRRDNETQVYAARGQTSVQRSQAGTNLKSGLESEPRYIRSPNSSQNLLAQQRPQAQAQPQPQAQPHNQASRAQYSPQTDTSRYDQKMQGHSRQDQNPRQDSSGKARQDYDSPRQDYGAYVAAPPPGHQPVRGQHPYAQRAYQQPQPQPQPQPQQQQQQQAHKPHHIQQYQPSHQQQQQQQQPQYQQKQPQQYQRQQQQQQQPQRQNYPQLQGQYPPGHQPQGHPQQYPQGGQPPGSRPHQSPNPYSQSHHDTGLLSKVASGASMRSDGQSGYQYQFDPQTGAPNQRKRQPPPQGPAQNYQRRY